MMVKKCKLLQPLAVGVCVLIIAPAATAYQLADEQWVQTVNQTYNGFGSPLEFTWSIVPDDTSISSGGSSDLVSFLDQIFLGGPGSGSDLTQRPWFDLFDQSINRWGEISGASFVYQPNDDGVTHGPAFAGSNLTGRERGDIRIGGKDLGFAAGTANLPEHGGDILLNSAFDLQFQNPDDNYRYMRNVIMHEMGHALGLKHVESDAHFLLEPISLTNFAYDGPQLDEIRGVQRLYGDLFEQSNGGQGNGIPENAVDLGQLAHQETAVIGLSTENDPQLPPEAIDFISVSGQDDVDFFSFAVSGPSTVDIVLTPVGPIYNESQEGGVPQDLNSAESNDLTLAIGVLAPGLVILDRANTAPAGIPEILDDIMLPVGDRYYVRIEGQDVLLGGTDEVQTYQLSITVTAVPEPSAPVMLWLTWLFACRVLKR